MASESNTTNNPLIDIVEEGGSAERSLHSELKKKGKNPEDVKAFYASRYLDIDIITRVTNLLGKQQTNQRPKPLTNLGIKIQPYSVNGRTFARIDVDFAQDSDPNFAGARVYVKGYGTDNVLGSGGDKGDSDEDSLGREETLSYQMIAQVDRSPASFVLEATDEQLIIGVEAINKDGIGSGLDTMPTQAIDNI